MDYIVKIFTFYSSILGSIFLLTSNSISLDLQSYKLYHPLLMHQVK